METHSHDRGRHPARGLRHGRRHVRVEESHESATAARELEQATADCATAHAAAKKAEQKLVEYLDGDRLAQAKAVTADKLADPETLETLDKLAEQYSEGERIPACAATDTETANATTSKLQAIEKKHTEISRG